MTARKEILFKSPTEYLKKVGLQAKPGSTVDPQWDWYFEKRGPYFGN